MTTVAKTTAKKSTTTTTKAAAKNRVVCIAMTPEQLHRDMVAYGKKVTATKASALAFLKRIGAPV